MGAVLRVQGGSHDGPANAWHGLAVVIAFSALHAAVDALPFHHWRLAAGLLFAALWALPRGWWPWLVASTLLARIGVAAVSTQPTADGAVLLLDALPEPALIAFGVVYLQRHGLAIGSHVDTNALTRLHLAALVSAVAVTAKDTLLAVHGGVIADVGADLLPGAQVLADGTAWESGLRFALRTLLSCFVGIMLVAPAAMWAASASARSGGGPVMLRGLRVLVPVSVGFIALGLVTRNADLAELLRRLLLVVVVVMAVRDGWRGAAFAMLVVGMLVGIDSLLGEAGTNPLLLQAFVAIAGGLGLMLGAAFDEVRSRRQELEALQARTDELRMELAAAASRSLQTQEREQIRIGAELHDEFGQSLTALQTHLRLLIPDFHASGRSFELGALMDLTRTMRQNIRSVLERLRPAALDELGLFGAINGGSLRQLAEHAGLRFDVELLGDARLLAHLDDATRIAAYRLVQEAVTNTVRHAHARRLHVRLRIEQRGGGSCLFIAVRDDGIGIDPTRSARRGGGMSIMQDRITALGGRLHIQRREPGLRVHALLRQVASD